MINKFGNDNNLHPLNVYWCNTKEKTTELFDSLHRFPKLERLSVADMELFPEEISSNGKIRITKIKKTFSLQNFI